MLDAIILAGNDDVKGNLNECNKAMLDLNGRRMIDYVIEALKGSGYIDRIIITGHKESLHGVLEQGVYEIVDCRGSIMDGLLKGARCSGAGRKLLICSCDLPFITAEAVRDFIEKSLKSGADLCYPIVDKRENDIKFPGVRRTYVKLREGVFTGGNVLYADLSVLEKGAKLAEKLLLARKNPLKMARIIGLSFLISLAMGVLSIEKIEKRLSMLINVRGKAILSQYPEIGNDIDKPEDIAFAERYFRNKG